MTRIAVVGATGRMGLSLIKAATLNNDTQLTTAIARAGNESIGKDAGELAGCAKLNVRINEHLESMLNEFDILIDFTRPEISMEYIEICRKANKKVIIGTTGYSEEQKAKIADIAKEIAIVLAPNMSVGVNLSLKLLEITANKTSLIVA